MNTPDVSPAPRYTLMKGILALAAGWAIGLGLMVALRQIVDSPLTVALGQGVSFLGFFIGFYWLSEYWRWKRSGNREIFQPRPLLYHLVAAFVGATALVLVTLVLQR